MSARGMILALLLSLAAGRAAAAETAAELYNQGNAAYGKGDFAQAAELYRSALAQGGKTAEVYYNLGNASWKAGDLGRAVAAYERAWRLKPRDPDAAHNLRFARVQIKGKLPAVERGFWLENWDRLRDGFSLDELTLVLSVGWFLFGGGLAARLSNHRPWMRSAGSAVLGAGLAALLLAGPVFAAKLQKEVLTQEAVILAERVEARSGPGPQNAQLFELFAGMDVIVRQCESGWCEVRVPGGLAGWIAAGTFEMF